MIRKTAGFSVLILLLALSACTSRRGRQATNAYPPITVSVDNQNFYDATVYLRWRGDRRRLGVVTGNTRTTYESPWYGPDVQIEIQLLAGNRHTGDPIGVSPGDQLIVEIPANADRFRVFRRSP
ncbi:MAG: hypothetical protein L0271_21365 [Gemmatimonadetes bacterium]|nr:hypothetical protein [Gemmatimonadota bacterium]